MCLHKICGESLRSIVFRQSAWCKPLAQRKKLFTQPGQQPVGVTLSGEQFRGPFCSFTLRALEQKEKGNKSIFCRVFLLSYVQYASLNQSFQILLKNFAAVCILCDLHGRSSMYSFKYKKGRALEFLLFSNNSQVGIFHVCFADFAILVLLC